MHYGDCILGKSEYSNAMFAAVTIYMIQTGLLSSTHFSLNFCFQDKKSCLV